MKREMVKVNALAFAHLIKNMDGTLTCQELAEQSGLHYVTVLHYTRTMHKVGAAHISGWDKDSRGRDIIKLYKLGPGRDAKREKMGGAERQRRYRAKRKMGELIAATAGGVK